MRLEGGRRGTSFARRGGERGFAGDEEATAAAAAAHVDVDLSGMALESLPGPFLNLAAITKLDLSNNNLESIPESLVARLLNVVELDVHSNQLQTLPNSIGCLSKLRLLNVSGNMLESLPKTIEDCRALEELHANFNKLTALPETMGFELTNLQKLCVSSNRLASLPSSTSHMTSLRLLDAHLNCLHSLPDGLENLSRLQLLNVAQNFRYLRSLPASLGLLAGLLELDVSYNHLAALPDSLACLGKLRKLRAEGNPLVSPPMDVVEHGVDAVRQYLTARINGGGGKSRKSWFGRLVKCGTFTTAGGMATKNGVPRLGGEEEEGLFPLQYRSIDGLASPRHVRMLFSPRRLFSPSRSSPKWSLS